MFQYRTNFTEEDGIDHGARNIFCYAAEALNVTIVVRAINPGSLKYLGKPGFQPKLQDCHLKTAEDGTKSGVEGLVVSPYARADCFPSKAGIARQMYKKFILFQHATERTYHEALQKLETRQQTERQTKSQSTTQRSTSAGGLPQSSGTAAATVSPYSFHSHMHPYDTRLNVCYETGLSPYGVETQGRFRGVLKHRPSRTAQANYVCGDWDLKDIFRTPAEPWVPVLRENQSVLTNRDREHYSMTSEENDVLFSQNENVLYTATTLYSDSVERFVNQQYGCEAIKHGEEAQVTDHRDDALFVFSNRHLIALRQPMTIGRQKIQQLPAETLNLPTCFLVKGKNNIGQFYEMIGRNLTARFTRANEKSPFAEPVYDPPGRRLTNGIR